jgi:hypothetical protein
VALQGRTQKDVEFRHGMLAMTKRPPYGFDD